MIDVAPDASGRNPHRTGRRVDAHAFHQRKIDHQSALAGPEPGSIVATAADRGQQPVFSSVAHCRHHIGHVDCTHDQRRALIDHRVEDSPGCVVCGICWLDEL
ncbi:MAG TPA: hypothetical protein VLX60_07590, partial [Terriglobales bacterium]|nr:hypothetical protein [Terriglobales bacterium]